MAVGLPLLAREVSSDPLKVAAVFAAGRVPWVFALVVGSLVDRCDARPVLVGADSVRAASLLLFGWWLIRSDDLPSVWLICVISAILALFSISFFAALQRVVPALVGGSELEKANGYLDAGVNTGEQFVGPAMGAYFAAGGAIPVLVDAASFAISATVLRRLPSMPSSPTAEMSSLRRDVATGWNWFRSSSAMIVLTAATAAMTGLQSFVLATEVIIVRDTLKLPKFWFGPFTAILAAGAIFGSLVAARLIARLGSTTFSVTTITGALCFLACAGTRSVPVVFGAMTLQSFTIGVNNVSNAALRQRAVPVPLRGRVISLIRTFVFGVQIPGALMGGWLAARHGTDTLFTVVAGGFIGIVAVTARPLRRLLAPYQAGPHPTVEGANAA